MRVINKSCSTIRPDKNNACIFAAKVFFLVLLLYAGYRYSMPKKKDNFKRHLKKSKNAKRLPSRFNKDLN